MPETSIVGFRHQFYPQNVEFDARARSKQLMHKKSVKAYVKEFENADCLVNQTAEVKGRVKER